MKVIKVEPVGEQVKPAVVPALVKANLISDDPLMNFLNGVYEDHQL